MIRPAKSLPPFFAPSDSAKTILFDPHCAQIFLKFRLLWKYVNARSRFPKTPFFYRMVKRVISHSAICLAALQTQVASEFARHVISLAVGTKEVEPMSFRVPTAATAVLSRIRMSDRVKKLKMNRRRIYARVVKARVFPRFQGRRAFFAA